MLAISVRESVLRSNQAFQNVECIHRSNSVVCVSRAISRLAMKSIRWFPMPIRVFKKSPELTLFFDRKQIRISAEQLIILSQKLKQVEGITSVQTNRAWYRTPRVRIVLDEATEPIFILRKMASVLRSSGNEVTSDRDSTFVGSPCEAGKWTCTFRHLIGMSPACFRGLSTGRPVSNSTQHDFPATRFREFGYGALAVGSLAMSWIGLIFNGIPAVPFVLLTAHFAIQTSPRLHVWLMKGRVFGPIFRDLHEHGAIRRRTKIHAYIWTIVVDSVGFVMSPKIFVLYAGMGIATGFSLYVISKIPTIESEDDSASLNGADELESPQTESLRPSIALG